MGFDFEQFRALIQETGGNVLLALRKYWQPEEERERREQPYALTSEEFTVLREHLVAEWKARRITKTRLISLLRGAAGCLRSTERYTVRRQARQVLLRILPIEDIPEADRDGYSKAVNALREIARPGRDVREFIRFWRDIHARAGLLNPRSPRSSPSFE